MNGDILTRNEVEIVEAVDRLNDELYKKMYDPSKKNQTMPAFSYNICFNGVSVDFFLDRYDNYQILRIFNSEDDQRIYDDRTETYESYYDCFVRIFNETVDDLNQIKL